MKTAIYSLSDRTGIRYIGQSVDPDRRYRQHLADTTGSDKSEWIQGLTIPPRMRVIEWTQKPDEREIYWIKKYGSQLTNSTHNNDKDASFAMDNQPLIVQILNTESSWIVKLFALVIYLFNPKSIQLEKHQVLIQREIEVRQAEFELSQMVDEKLKEMSAARGRRRTQRYYSKPEDAEGEQEIVSVAIG